MPDSIRQWTSLLLFVLVSTGSVAGDDQDDPAIPLFSDVDSNADMYIDPEEFEAFIEQMRPRDRGDRRPPVDRMTRMFERADSNQDGLLNEAEFDALQPYMRRIRERINGDGGF